MTRLCCSSGLLKKRIKINSLDNTELCLLLFLWHVLYFVGRLQSGEVKNEN